MVVTANTLSVLLTEFCLNLDLLGPTTEYSTHGYRPWKQGKAYTDDDVDDGDISGGVNDVGLVVIRRVVAATRLGDWNIQRRRVVVVVHKVWTKSRQIRKTYRAHTRGDRRRDYRSDRRGDDCLDDRPVYTLQAIVATTNTCLMEQPTGDGRRDDRSVYTPYYNDDDDYDIPTGDKNKGVLSPVTMQSKLIKCGIRLFVDLDFYASLDVTLTPMGLTGLKPRPITQKGPPK